MIKSVSLFFLLSISAFNMEWLSGISINSQVNNMELVDGIAYLASRNEGLITVDFKNPSEPMLLSKSDGLLQARAVSVSGNFAFVADNSFGLKIFDVSNPSVPELVGEYELVPPASVQGNDKSAYGICLYKNYALVVGLSRLTVIDVTNPKSPQYVSELEGAGINIGRNGGKKLVTYMDYVYMVHKDSTVLVINLANAQQPSLLEPIHLGGKSSYDLAIVSNKLVVSTQASNLEVYDITNPETPQYIGSQNIAGSAYFMRATENTLYVGGNTINKLEFSNSQGSTWMENFSIGGTVGALAVEGDYILASNSLSLQLLKGTSLNPNPLFRKLLSQLSTKIGNFNNRVAITGSGGAFTLFDVSDHAMPELQFNRPANFFVEDTKIGFNQDHLFLNIYSDLEMWNLGDSAKPFLEGTYRGTNISDFEISGATAFIVGNSFAVVDVSNPLSPKELYIEENLTGYTNVLLTEQFAYVFGPSGIRIYDFSILTSPVLVDDISSLGAVLNMQILGENAFLLGADSTIHSLNLQSFTPLASFKINRDVFDMELMGERLFLATGSSQILTVQISDPIHLKMGPSYYSPGDSKDISVSQDYIYVADGWAGFSIVEISKPTTGLKFVNRIPMHPEAKLIQVPASNSHRQIKINWEAHLMPEAIYIYNMMGRQIKKINAKGQGFMYWDVSLISPGSYYYRFYP